MCLLIVLLLPRRFIRSARSYESGYLFPMHFEQNETMRKFSKKNVSYRLDENGVVVEESLLPVQSSSSSSSSQEQEQQPVVEAMETADGGVDVSQPLVHPNQAESIQAEEPKAQSEVLMDLTLEPSEFLSTGTAPPSLSAAIAPVSSPLVASDHDKDRDPTPMQLETEEGEAELEQADQGNRDKEQEKQPFHHQPTGFEDDDAGQFTLYWMESGQSPKSQAEERFMRSSSTFSHHVKEVMEVYEAATRAENLILRFRESFDDFSSHQFYSTMYIWSLNFLSPAELVSPSLFLPLSPSPFPAHSTNLLSLSLPYCSGGASDPHPGRGSLPGRFSAATERSRRWHRSVVLGGVGELSEAISSQEARVLRRVLWLPPGGDAREHSPAAAVPGRS